MTFSMGFVATSAPPLAYCPVGLVQTETQAVAVAMPIIKEGSAPT